jgi:hypothetical protein
MLKKYWSKNNLEKFLYIFLFSGLIFFDSIYKMIWGSLGSYGFYGTIITANDFGYNALIFNLIVDVFFLLIIPVFLGLLNNKRTLCFGFIFLIYLLLGYMKFEWWQAIYSIFLFFLLFSKVFRLKKWLFFFLSIIVSGLIYYSLSLFYFDRMWLFLFSGLLTHVITMDFYWRKS